MSPVMRDVVEIVCGVMIGLAIASGWWAAVNPPRVRLPWEDEE
jgi:hypothetical protein